MKHTWTKGGKTVKNTGKGKTVAQTNKETVSKINKHSDWWKKTPLERAKALEDK